MTQLSPQQKTTPLPAHAVPVHFSTVSLSPVPVGSPFSRASGPLRPPEHPWIQYAGGPCRLQPKLAIGRPGDPFEQEADRVADQVMRMPAPAVQRNPACPAGAGRTCRDDDDAGEGLVQRKMAEDSPGAADIPPVVREVLRSPGEPLDTWTRAFMEPRFGHTFGNVRIHRDARAAESAMAIGAHAYTVGHDIVFAAGAYRPETGEGNRLLAHELTHVAQQSRGTTPGSPAGRAGGSLVRRRTGDGASREGESGPGPVTVLNREDPGSRLHGQWISCGTPAECPARATGEEGRARRAPLHAGELVDPVPGFIVWGFSIGSSETRGLAGNATWTAFDANLARGADRWTLLGFSDCSGLVEHNRTLRNARARAVYNALSPGARARIVSSAGAPLEDCVAANDTERNRSFNRAAVFRRSESRVDMPDEPVRGSRCPPRHGTIARSLADYITLVRCAESRTRYNPRQMLAMLRQLYYGKPWSFTSRTSNWDNVIRGSPDLGNPSALLGRDLFEALGNSAEVGGVDVGHIFTGLEAMTSPTRDVNFYWGLATVGTPNEDFATWAGDLGAAVAAFHACPLTGSAATSDNCGHRAGRQPLDFYLETVHAPPQDLEGDIDSYVIRATESGVSCGTSGLRRLSLTRPVSEILGDYYYSPGTPLGTARPNRNRCFLELMGATFDASGRVNNRAALIHGPMMLRVHEFARAFYTNIRGMPFTPDGTELRLMRFSAEYALNWFITILERRSPVTP